VFFGTIHRFAPPFQRAEALKAEVLFLFRASDFSSLLTAIIPPRGRGITAPAILLFLLSLILVHFSFPQKKSGQKRKAVRGFRPRHPRKHRELLLVLFASAASAKQFFCRIEYLCYFLCVVARAMLAWEAGEYEDMLLNDQIIKNPIDNHGLSFACCD
jgi:hypothetical protein